MNTETIKSLSELVSSLRSAGCTEIDFTIPEGSFKIKIALLPSSTLIPSPYVEDVEDDEPYTETVERKAPYNPYDKVDLTIKDFG